MSLSTITPVVSEASKPSNLSSFVRSGVVYLVWAEGEGPLSAQKRLRWRPHSSLEGTEIVCKLSRPFNNAIFLHHPPADQLYVFWDDSASEEGFANGSIYWAKLNPTTGDVVAGPTYITQGAEPEVIFREDDYSKLLLFFRTPKSAGVYSSMSQDGGLTWQSAVPLLSGQVRNTTNIRVLPYGPLNVSISQVGDDSRNFLEMGMYSRTRPLQSILRHPTSPNLFYVSEPSKFDNTTLTDNLRGRLRLSPGSTSVLVLQGTRQGTSDGNGSLCILNIPGNVPTLAASTGPVAGASGRNLVEYALNLTSGSLNVTLPGADSFAVDFDTSSTHAYVAEYSDSTSNGQFIVVRLSDGTTSTVLSGLTGVRAVAVAGFTPTPLIFVATTELGQEHLRVYQENGMSPTLLKTVRLTHRANTLFVTAGSGAVTAKVWVSCKGRVSIYEYYDASSPIRLQDALEFSGDSEMFNMLAAPNGNLFAAAGNSGVVVFSPKGRVISQHRVAGVGAPEWTRYSAYSVGDLVSPTQASPFYPNRYYFRCTTAGVAGGVEPSWSVSSNVIDGNAVWSPMGSYESIVTDLEIDAATKTVYAVGVAGGPLGTIGRVWVLKPLGGLL